MAKAVGIDLGTTNSVVAVMEDGAPVIIPNAEGQLTTPSVVGFSPEDELLVGQAALDQAVAFPDRTSTSFKRQMGVDWTAELGTYQYRPQELAARVLQKLKHDAEAYLGEPVTAAVISVPGCSNHAQRLATRQAGQIAGFETVRLISETSAAALTYVHKKLPISQKLVMLNLGGGTSEVSVMSPARHLIKVKSIQGNTQLGGDEWDNAIVDRLMLRFKLEHSVDLTANAVARMLLKRAAEQAKKDLSRGDVASIKLAITPDSNSSRLNLDYNLTRSEFEELTVRIMSECLEPLHRAFLFNDIRPRETKRRLYNVCVIGGLARVPSVQEFIRKRIDPAIRISFLDEEVVATGAAIQAGALMGDATATELRDVAPYSVGFETPDGKVYPCVVERMPIPIGDSRVFSTAVDYQTTMPIHVLYYEASWVKAKDCTTIDRYTLNDIRQAWAGIPQLGVTFAIDADGIVSVTAQDIEAPDEPLTVTGESWLVDFEVDHEFPDEDSCEISHDTGEPASEVTGPRALDEGQVMAAGIADLAQRLLPVLDSCEDIRQSEAADAAAIGVVGRIESQLLSALAQVGVSPISPVGGYFNPYEHELASGPDGQPPADGVGVRVAGVLRTGYRSPDRILRPATVYVEPTSQPAEPSTPDTNNQPSNATDPAAAPNPPADG